MPPQPQEDPGPIGLGTATVNSDSQLLDLSATVRHEPSSTLTIEPMTSDGGPTGLTLAQSSTNSAATVEALDTEQLDRRRPESDRAEENAVLLAKTQATAAWVQSETLWRQMKELEHDLAAERDQAERVASELSALRRELEVERHERVTAQAASNELRQYLDQQQGHLGFLRDRIVSMESERDIQQSCLGWFGRRRFRRLLQQRWEADPRSVLLADGGQASVGNPLAVAESSADQQLR